jgi:hypothetical protein
MAWESNRTCSSGEFCGYVVCPVFACCFIVYLYIQLSVCCAVQHEACGVRAVVGRFMPYDLLTILFSTVQHPVAGTY